MYAWSIRHTEDRQQFDALLYDPPEGAAPSERLVQQERDDFAAFAAAMSGR